MSQAQFNVDNRNYEGALNGDTVINPIDSSTTINKGFKDIISDYAYTEAANLSNYYAAIHQLDLGSKLDSSKYFEEALISLNNFETDDEIISSLSTGLKGDVYMELENTTEAMNFYKSAATDYVNDPRSAIIDGLSTMVVDGTQVKILAWYDNEWGYSNRLVDLAVHMSGVDK